MAGKFEQASGGTLFLDELGELSTAGQAKLLRAIETREITPVGGARSKRVDLRLVAATNADLETEVCSGRFRRDLYSRLNGVSITMPPVRHRGPDVTILIDFVLARASSTLGIPASRLTPEAHSILVAYPWPGNVREIETVLKHALLHATGDITVADLPAHLLAKFRGVPPPDCVLPPGVTLPEALKDLSSRLEAGIIAQALVQSGNNVTKAAAALGIHRMTLTRKRHQPAQ
jgi:transcriptional regulator with PAS, ATPase and Fis domain